MSLPNLNLDRLRDWIGKSQTEFDTITAAPLRMMRATLNLPQALTNSPAQTDEDLPALWHWLYFLPAPQQSALGEDGHAKRGGFLPPVPLPRRMWAAGQFEFFHNLQLGDQVTRISTIDDVTLKSGRTGSLCFVRVRHEVSNNAGLALREFHDIVYRPNLATNLSTEGLETKVGMTFEQAPVAHYSQTITPTDTLLFRYSALTFNTHRIHYDRKYVTQVESYPGLIVHGPLMATMLVGFATQLNPNLKMRRFEFRALKPVFDLHPFEICASKPKDGVMDLWVKDFEGHVTMRASMQWGQKDGSDSTQAAGL